MISAAGRNIRTFRVHNGISQMDFSEKTGIAQTTISAWECGTTAPRASAIDKVLKAYPTLTYDLIMSEEKGYQKQLFKYREEEFPHVDGSLLELCKIWQVLDVNDRGIILKIAQALGHVEMNKK